MVGAAVETGDNAGVGRRIIGNVDAAAAVEHIGAGAAGQRIIAGTTAQRVITAAASEMVGKGRTGQALDRNQRIALRIAAFAQTAVERDIDCRCRCGIIGRVDPVATVEHISPGTADQRVIACPARQHVVTGIAGQHVGKGRTGQPFDRNQRIAFGIATMRAAGGKIDRDRSIGCGIVGHIIAIAAVENIGPGTADQRVVAIAARQLVDPAITDQQVVVVGPRNIFDRLIGIALGRAARSRACGQVDRDTGGGIGIVGGVGAVAAHQRIRAKTTAQRVIACAAIEQVAGGIADQCIGIGSADDMLDAAQHIALRHIADRSGTIEIDRDRPLRVGIIRRVETAAADQGIGARTADQRIVAQPAVDDIGAAVAGEAIAKRRSGQVFDTDQHIAFGIAAMAHAAIERDIHGGRRGVIIGGVDAVATHQRVGAGAADQRVVAGPALQAVIDRRTIDRVVECRADDMFDIGDDIALGIAAARHRAVEMDFDRSTRRAVVHRVEPGAAINRVGPGPADQRIIAAAAQQHVIAAAAKECVVECRAFEPFNADIRIAERIAALVAAVERGGDPGRRPGIGGNVEPVAAVEHIGARTAFERVVAHPAGQRFVACAADQMIVERRADQGLDIGIRIALGVAAVADLAIEEHFDANRRIAEIDGVAAAAAIDMVGARATFDGVVFGAADQRIIVRRTDEDFDPGDHIARSAAAPRGAVEMDFDAGGGARIIDRINAVATDDRIAAATTDKCVVARAAFEHFGGAGAMEGVRPVGADDVLDIDQRIALRGAAMVGRAVKVDFDASQCARVGAVGQGLPVESVAVIDCVEAAAAIDVICTRAAVEHVVVCIAGQGIVERRSDDVLDIAVSIALGKAAAALARTKIDGDPFVRQVIDHGVAAGAAIELVCTCTGVDGVVAIAGVDHAAGRVGIEHIDRIAGDGVGYGRVTGRIDDLDAELVGNLGGERRILAVGGQTEFNRQIEFLLESSAVDGRIGRGNGVDQLHVKRKKALAGRCGLERGFAGGCVGDRNLSQFGDVALGGINQPAVGRVGRIGNGIAGRQRRDQHLQQAERFGGHFGDHMQHAHGIARRGVVGGRGINDIIATGAGDGLFRGLRGVTVVL